MVVIAMVEKEIEGWKKSSVTVIKRKKGLRSSSRDEEGVTHLLIQPKGLSRSINSY